MRKSLNDVYMGNFPRSQTQVAKRHIPNGYSQKQDAKVCKRKILRESARAKMPTRSSLNETAGTTYSKRALPNDSSQSQDTTPAKTSEVSPTKDPKPQTPINVIEDSQLGSLGSIGCVLIQAQTCNLCDHTFPMTLSCHLRSTPKRI